MVEENLLTNESEALDFTNKDGARALTNGPQAAGFWGLSKKSTNSEETKSPRAAKASEIQNTHVKP